VDSALQPDPRAYVARPATEEALERLEAAVRLGRPGLLSGPAGTGKTLVLGLLAERLAPYFEVVPLSMPAPRAATRYAASRSWREPPTARSVWPSRREVAIAATWPEPAATTSWTSPWRLPCSETKSPTT
jgi:hypothetical protein